MLNRVVKRRKNPCPRWKRHDWHVDPHGQELLIVRDALDGFGGAHATRINTAKENQQ